MESQPTSQEEQPQQEGQTLRVQETLYRFIQVSELDKPYRGHTQYGPSAVHIQAGPKDCLIEETMSDGVCVGLRIRALYIPEIIFNSTTLSYYKEVTRFEVSSPVASVWLFDWIACLPSLKYLRLGNGFFEDCDERGSKDKFEPSPSIRELVISFDKRAFDGYEKKKQERLKNKLDNILDLCVANLTGLQYVDLTLPSGPTLDLFLNKVPSIKGRGIKTVNFHNKTESFRTVTKQHGPSTDKRKCPPHPKPKEAPKKKVNQELVTEETDREGRGLVEVVNISSGDDDEDQEKEPTPPLRTDAQSNENNNKRNGRESPSLLER